MMFRLYWRFHPCAAFLVLLSSLILSTESRCEVPDTIVIQGTLADVEGGPVTGSHPYQIGFFDSEIGGSELFIATGTLDLSEAGRFSIQMTPPPVLIATPAVWYQLAIDTDGDGFDAADFFPNLVRVQSVPFALSAGDTASLGGTPAEEYATDSELASELAGVSSSWLSDGTHVYQLTGNVGIGTDSPDERLDVRGTARFSSVQTFLNDNRTTSLGSLGGSGLIRTYGENGNYNAEIGWDRLTPPTEDNDKNHGAIALFDEDQDDRVKLLINSDSAGALILDGSNGNGNVILGGTDGFPDFGRIAVLNSDGETSASLSAGRYGFLDMFGENGSKSVRIGGTISHPDEGAVLLSDDQGEERASLQVDSEGAGELVLDGP
ncbi:MAG: hypothetical protein KC944_22670, partial [Candidatus Omnitrophica bacterium]|nr:hypothetical protein [Candidatus Omnitrophota bacterium]